jgi:hypothetical protein
MTVDRLGNSGVQPQGPRRTEVTPRDVGGNPGGAVDRARPEGELSADTVELSADVSGVTSSEAVPSGEIDPARLRDIARRIADGSYDTPAARDKIAGRILEDLDHSAGG